MRENQKPKKPQSGFLRFLSEAATKLPRTEGQTYREWQKNIAVEWNKLNEDQKNVYNSAYQGEFVKYKQEIAKWELKMIRVGNIDLVRDETLIEHETSGKPRLRSNKPKVRSASSDSD